MTMGGQIVWEAILLAVLLSAFTEGELCFRKHSERGGQHLCKGLIRKQFSSAHSCCKNKRGVAFAFEEISQRPLTSGFYRCIPCSQLLEFPDYETEEEEHARQMGEEQTNRKGNREKKKNKKNRNRKDKKDKRRGRGREEEVDLYEQNWGRTSIYHDREMTREYPEYGKRNKKKQNREERERNRENKKKRKNKNRRKDKFDWTDWSGWSDCSETCGAGIQIRERDCLRRKRACDGDATENRPCQIHAHCPVDGNWGPWFKWSPCSTSCGSGMRTRERLCNDPPPVNGGRDCDGKPEEHMSCNIRPCPIDGKWGSWTEWGACSRSCDTGSSRRRRACDSPAPAYGGKNCQGDRRESVKCNTERCPVDGSWSLWSEWGACSVTCDVGTKLRLRKCDSPRPMHGGEECSGQDKELEKCRGEKHHCPVDGAWSEWSSWTDCDADKCSGVPGFRIRSRMCSDPSPRFGGKMCHGDGAERKTCYTTDETCPEPGQWCPWVQWGPCEERIEGNIVRERKRKCDCPAAVKGGEYCQGASFEEENCTEINRSISKDKSKGSACGLVASGSGSGSGMAESDGSEVDCDQEMDIDEEDEKDIAQNSGSGSDHLHTEAQTSLDDEEIDNMFS